MESIYYRMGAFAAKRFSDATAVDHLEKLRQEAKEAKENPTDIVEYSDCLLCLFAAAHKSGFTYQELIIATSNKLSVVIDREWIKQPDGTYQHKK